VNSHLVVGHKNNAGRINQIDIINRMVEEAKSKYNCTNVIWTGDFNVSDESPEYIRMTKELNYCDAGASVDYDHDKNGNFDQDEGCHEAKQAKLQKMCTWQPHVNPFTDGTEAMSRIDFIFYNADAKKGNGFHTKPMQYQRCFDEPDTICSDHYGVQSTLILQ
jgi:endonuclease/exonuclease/phosphatase family metal-dependent hydrolase